MTVELEKLWKSSGMNWLTL